MEIERRCISFLLILLSVIAVHALWHGTTHFTVVAGEWLERVEECECYSGNNPLKLEECARLRDTSRAYYFFSVARSAAIVAVRKTVSLGDWTVVTLLLSLFMLIRYAVRPFIRWWQRWRDASLHASAMNE
jgi:hypothetical protein